MLRALFKIAIFFLYAILILIGVTFAVSNRARVDVTFFPSPYAASVPLFLLAIVVLGIGVLWGWITVWLGQLGKRKLYKDAQKRIAALENELAALRAEQFIKPVSLLRQDDD